MTSEEITERLYALREEDYRRFQSTLLPGVEHILGVRLPHLRALAKKIARQPDWRELLAGIPRESFEQTMLQGMVIGCLQAPPKELLALAADFVPNISNWSLCDSFCSGFKLAVTHPADVWAFILPYFEDTREYHVRFGVVMLLFYFLTDEYLERSLTLLGCCRHEGYYAKMAVAWAVSIAYVRFPARVYEYLAHCPLDDFTYNKALQKITESRCVSAEQKALIGKMRRARL